MAPLLHIFWEVCTSKLSSTFLTLCACSSILLLGASRRFSPLCIVHPPSPRPPPKKKICILLFWSFYFLPSLLNTFLILFFLAHFCSFKLTLVILLKAIGAYFHVKHMWCLHLQDLLTNLEHLKMTWCVWKV